MPSKLVNTLRTLTRRVASLFVADVPTIETGDDDDGGDDDDDELFCFDF